MKANFFSFIFCFILVEQTISQNGNEGKIIPTDTLTEVVITASLYPEKIIRAPAPIQVVTAKDINHFGGSNVGELFAMVQGVEFTRYGVDGTTFNARGLNSAFNNKMLQIVDGRISTAPLSGGLPLFNNGTINKEDIDQIEIVVGPQTALYGPNAHNGVFNTITKDPYEYPGTTVSLSTGSQDQFSGRLRLAQKINENWAWKVTGEYATGREFIFRDSVYVGVPQTGIPEHNVDFDFKHLRGEAHLYYRFNSKTNFIVSGGTSTNDFLQVTTSGRNQMKGVDFSFLQARFTSPHLYANVYSTWGSLGESYVIGAYTRTFWARTQTGAAFLPPDEAEQVALSSARFKEESQRLNAEVQYRTNFPKMGLFLVSGLDFENSRPNTDDGNTLVGKGGQISVSQIGGIVQLDKKLPWNLRAIGAIRFDKNDNFEDMWAPKFTIAKDFEGGHLRLGWAKAFAIPSIQNQYANIQGFFFGNGGDGIAYIPNNSNINNSASIQSTQPLKPEEVRTWEFGFKGRLTPKIWIDVNTYYGVSKNFITSALPVGGRALSVNNIEVSHNPNFAGTVNNDILEGATLFTFFNYGEAKIYGLDAGVNWDILPFVQLSFNYSWIEGEFRDNDANNNGTVSPDEKSINAPNQRGNARLILHDLCKKRLTTYVGIRCVQQYDFYSGNQVGSEEGAGTRIPPYNFNYGSLGGFATFDFGMNYELSKKIQVNFNLTNIFNTKQIEFVGSPSIGRLAMASIKISD